MDLPMPHLPMPSLQACMRLSVQVAAPVEAGQVQHAQGSGRRRIIPIVGGQVSGEVNNKAGRFSFEGVVLPGGADFQMVTSSTAAELDARYILRLHDGSHLYVHNHAIRTGSAADIAALVRGEAVPHERIYFRCAPRFEAENPALAWMTQTLFLGTGARFPDRVEMEFYLVL
jgi:hypothetical protein